MGLRRAFDCLVAFAVFSIASSLWSFGFTERQIAQDMKQALTKALKVHGTATVSADTLQTFNQNLQTAALRGRAVLTIDNTDGLKVIPKASIAVVFSLSDQRPSTILWLITLFWAIYCLRLYRRVTKQGFFGGLALREGRFFDIQGNEMRLTPMQQQLLEMLWAAPSHRLSKQEICDSLWPRKEDASETLYTLIRRIKPVIEEHSQLKIEAERGRSYLLKIR